MIQQKQNWWDEDETVTPTKPAKAATAVKAPVKQQGNWWDEDEDVVPVAKTAPKPAPMSQPDATPWGDGQAFDDMYARKPQTDPMLSPLRPDARTLTSGAPTRIKPPAAPRGPVMSPAQRRATQPARDAAVAKRTEQANRWKNDSPFGTPVDEMGMPIAVTDAQREGGMYGVREDVGKAIVASPIIAERALVGAAEATLNTPGDVSRSLATPFAAGFDPNMGGIMAGAEFGVGADTLPERFAAGAEAGGFMDMQKKLEAAPRFDFSAAKIPVPKELESVSGSLAEGFLQYMAARGALGKFMPGGKTLAQFAKDVGATGIGYSGDTPRAADMLDPESMGMLADYVRWLKTQPGDTQGMGRFKNMAEDATINLLAMGLLRGGQAATNAMNPQALTPTNAGGARPGPMSPQTAPVAPPVGATQPPAQPQPIPPQVARQPAQPAQGPAPQPTPPPQAATAPPVPPVPPAAPTATAAAPQPTPAAVAPQPARQALGPAEQAMNAMPRKTREAFWRALSNSGMNRQQAEAAVKSLNDLPEGQNSMFDFELVRRFGQQYPRLKTNLQAMGRDWAITIPKDPRKGSPNRVLDDNVSTQIKSEGEFIDRTAQEVFGQPVNDTLDALGAGKRQLSAQYNSLLDFENPYGPNINRMRGQNKIKRMQEIDAATERLTNYLQRPEVMSEVPDWVRDRVMLDVGKDMRERLSDSAFLGIMRLKSPDLANLLQQGTPLRYSDDLWKQITTLYPTQTAHSLQSAYARAIRDALKGTDVEQRTAAEILIRKRGGSRVRANAASPDKRGFGLLHYLEEAVPGYRDLRREYGDVIGAEDAAELPRDFFRVANDDVVLKDWIEVKNDLSPQQQAALKSGMTTQIQQALRKKHETLEPWELDQPDALSTPNLTTLSQQPVLNALEKAFGADGKKMADAIRAASTRTDRVRSIHPNYGPRTAPNQEATKNASNLYGDPWGSEQNVIDNVSGSLAAAGGLSALNPATAAAAPLLLTGAMAKGLWNQWKRNKQLTGEEAEALADFFFRSRRPDLAEQVRKPRGPNAGDYAGAAIRDASIGTVAAAASDGDLLNNDPNLLLAGAAAGAGAGLQRARGRDAASRIKPPRAPRTTTPPAGPAVPPVVGPRPLPGQTSNASPTVTGALVGGAAGYAAAPEDQKGLGLVAGAAGGGVLGNRLAKGSRTKAPPSAKASDAWKRDPATLGLGTQDYLAYINAKHPPATPNQTPPYFVAASAVKRLGGNRQAAAAELADYAAYLKQRNAKPEVVANAERAAKAVADVDPMFFDDAAFNARMKSEITAGGEAAVAPARGAADALPGERPIRRGPPGVKPPPAKNGFGSRDLPMDEGPKTRRLYNASTIDRDPNGYLDPHVSDWVMEIANGATDEGSIDDYVKALVYMSDEPEKWLPMIVGRKIGKHPSEVTMDDIRQHGRLNIADADPEYDPIYQVGDYSRDESVTTLSGERKKMWQTDLYDNEDFREMPVGPEPNDYISREAVKLAQSLTGDDLVAYLQNLKSGKGSSKLLAGMSGNAEAIGAGTGAVFATDVDGDGEVSFGERAGAAITGGVIGNALRRSGAPRPKGPVGPNIDAAGIKAYHGSPHDFDKFDSSKIGTGEGAQAYGRGLYFAENEAVAKGYRDALTNKPNNVIESYVEFVVRHGRPKGEGSTTRGYLQSQGFPADDEMVDLVDKAIAGATPAGKATGYTAEAMNALLDRRLAKQGRLYEVDIDADHKDFLDWDQPVTRKLDVTKAGDGKAAWYAGDELELMVDNDAKLYAQRDMLMPLIEKYRRDPHNPAIRGPIDRAFKRASPDYGLKQIEQKHWPTAGDDFKRMEIEKGAEAAQQWAREQGFKGVKFLDQGSRNAGDGTRNYVVFDDQHVNIINKAGFFGGRPKPPAPRNALKGPPKGPPGTLSRMVAGGAVGGLAGSLGGDANAQEDLSAEMASTKKDIDDLNAALKEWDSLDVLGKQRLLIKLGRVQSTYVNAKGQRVKFDDGNTGDRTEPLFKAYADEKRDALAKAEAGLEVLKKQNAYRQFQKEQNPFFDAVRELGPSGAMALAGAAATVLRIRAVGKSKAAAKVIENDINDLLTNGPVKGLMKKGGADNKLRNRAVNMKDFYRKGGAAEDDLPFKYGPQGWKANPKPAKPGSLYSPKTTTKMDGVGSQFFRPNDIKVLGVGVLDSVAIMPFVSGAEEELKKAKEDVENGNESIEALRRVEKAKTDLAMYQAIQRIGWGLAGAGALGAAYRYKLPKPDIRGAEDEVTAIADYLKSIRPPRAPRGPKALPPPAAPQLPPVAAPSSQLLLPLLPPPPAPPKPKPKPKPKKP